MLGRIVQIPFRCLTLPIWSQRLGLGSGLWNLSSLHITDNRLLRHLLWCGFWLYNLLLSLSLDLLLLLLTHSGLNNSFLMHLSEHLSTLLALLLLIGKLLDFPIHILNVGLDVLHLTEHVSVVSLRLHVILLLV